MDDATLLTIDGSHGEGGGQIVRTALSLAAITGRAIEIVNIRAGRTPPGLKAQHVAAARAAGTICAAETDGVEVSAQQLRFAPGAPVQPGEHYFEVGTAGAATLVLQTVLLPLALCAGDSSAAESVVRIAGGTHVPHAPTAEYIDEVYLPALAGLGVAVEFQMDRAGFFPRGGGLLEARIGSRQTLQAVAASRSRGKLETVEAIIVAANLPDHVSGRGATAILDQLDSSNIARGKIAVDTRQPSSVQPGAAITLIARSGGASEPAIRAGFCALGERGRPIERVASSACEQFLRWHKEGAAQCDEHLADQLVLPAALTAGHHAWTTNHATEHLQTALWTARQFFPALEYKITMTKSAGALIEVETPMVD